MSRYADGNFQALVRPDCCAVTRPWRILLVDDNLHDRADARAALLKGSRRRYDFIEAELAQEALDYCAQQPAPDCMLLDFDLPDADAFELLARMPRDSHGITLVPVVILTGSPRQSLNQELLRAGAEDYVGKAWLGPESLTRGVENAIERHLMKRELWRERARQQVIADIAQAATDGPGNAMAALFERVRVLVQADIFLSHVLDIGTPPMLRLTADAGIDAPTRLLYLLLDPVTSLCGSVVAHGKPVFRHHLQEHDEEATAVLKKIGVQAYASYPLQVDGRVIGTLSFGSRSRVQFDDDECDFMATVASQVGAAWERLDLLRSKDNELRSLTDNSPDILTRFDRQLRHVFINAAITRVTGHTPAYFIGKSNRELGMPEALCARWERAMQHVFTTGEAQQVSFDFPAVTGLRHFDCQLVAEQRGDGRITHILGVTHDVTVRHQLDDRREELLEAERAARIESERVALIKDEFLATLSHELRTPLSAIMGWASLLKRASPSPELYRKGIDVIARNATDQAALIGDLLDMNRILSGKLRMESERVNLDAVAAAAIDTLAPAALAKGITLELVLAPDGPGRVLGDGARLQQVLWNLLANAVKFTAGGGVVTLAISERDGLVVATVTDNGTGIEASFLPFLFDRFSQSDGSAARVHGGLGLGLSIVKNLLELHGGSVSASSGGAGQGACFTVLLPRAPDGPMPRAAPAAVPEVVPEVLVSGPMSVDDSNALRGMAVLLVDDNPDVLELGRRLLTEHGALVTTAQSADAALLQIRRQVPDILLSDIGMPGTDGYQLIELVRTGMGLGASQLPAVAVTAYARAQDHARALQAGYQACIDKPIRPQLLIRTLLDLAAVKAAGTYPDGF
ncbi:response regulator [Actimicrobium sp. CCC2.4]|uniref:response regulator n=1 Tax=Actimicrobium sp. CCC2.4 TaxID=3048606 RepID=UPI002AC9038B|nr:response regulator [Actimicrobium sp. CCC2.4]MEB0135388.1 response regulator [Actimicrobium sp. CCC2.4]WPX32437.1 response regulator [Actimicrobium sp. CCC2.4]